MRIKPKGRLFRPFSGAARPSNRAWTVSALLGCAIGLGAAEPAIEKKPSWESVASLGLTVTAGNTETFLGAANVATKRKWPDDEVSLGAGGTYGKTTPPGGSRSRKTAESAYGFAQYNRLLQDRWFAYTRVDLLHDAVADVEYRLSVSPGMGYYFYKKADFELIGELGPGLINEKLGSGSQTYMTMRLAEQLNWKFSERARLWQKIEVLPQVDDFSNYIINAEVGVEATLTTKLKLRSYVQDTFDHEPAPGRKKNDLKWVTAIAYEF